MNAVIEEQPGFSERLGAYLQNIDPDLYADPQAYLAAHGLPADTLKELPREQVDIVHAEGTDPIGAFIQGNGNHFVKIAADGKIYDISGLVSRLGFGAYKAPPILATLYARNSAAQQQFEARQAIESGDPKRIAGVLIAGSALEPAMGAIRTGAALATERPGSLSTPVARAEAKDANRAAKAGSERGGEDEHAGGAAMADDVPAPGTPPAPDEPVAVGGQRPAALGPEPATPLEAPGIVSGAPSGKSLLPTEGNVGSYDDLIDAGTRGDGVTPHHMPSANHMNQYGIDKGDGISMNMEQPHPGVGGRHRATFNYGTKADAGMNAREALAAGVRDARRIYQRDGLYGARVRSGLRDVIRQNKAKFPKIFEKAEK
jgi:hypothetical protein